MEGQASLLQYVHLAYVRLELIRNDIINSEFQNLNHRLPTYISLQMPAKRAVMLTVCTSSLASACSVLTQQKDMLSA